MGTQRNREGEHLPQVRDIMGRARSQDPSLCCDLWPFPERGLPTPNHTHPGNTKGSSFFNSSLSGSDSQNGVKPKSLTFISDALPWVPVCFHLTGSTGESKALVHRTHTFWTLNKASLGSAIQRSQMASTSLWSGNKRLSLGDGILGDFSSFFLYF